MNTSKRQRKPTARYIAWYGMPMLTASRERSLQHAINRDNDNSAVMMWNTEDGSQGKIPHCCADVADSDKDSSHEKNPDGSAVVADDEDGSRTEIPKGNYRDLYRQKAAYKVIIDKW